MRVTESFDHLKTSLSGRKLIESSAGTGKTYAIASLFVRLLLERNLQVHEILVVTFTESATAELQARIRRKIKEALRTFESASPPQDEFLAGLAAATGNAAHARAVLSEALHAFDSAAISTIHGFCRKALQENAFESSSLFDTELLADQNPVCEQVVDDFWRATFHKTSATLMHQVLLSDLKSILRRLLGGSIPNARLKVLPEGPVPDIREVLDLESRARTSLEACAQIWSRESRCIESLLFGDAGLNRGTYAPAKVRGWLRELEPYFFSELLLPMPGGLEALSARALRAGTRKGHRPPEHPFFESVQTLSDLLEGLTQQIGRYLLSLKSEFIRYARRELPSRRRRLHVRWFDDLLLDMRSALSGPAGGTLAASLRKRFRAALIDEFQDTDPVQYEIFRTIFDESCSLFLIGDPKQAIYGFRGADVFAYIKAAEEVASRFTLTRNWRSTPSLVAAVNTIFLQRQTPFVLPDIRYFESAPAGQQSGAGIVVDGESGDAPLKICFLARDDNSSSTPLSKKDAQAMIPCAIASEIVRLLNDGREGHARIDGRSVSPWDLAVLVRTNEQARQMQQALRDRRVPSVIYGTGSVFDTEEAVELERLLAAIADPANEGKVKAALATTIMGVSGDELLKISEDEVEWDARLRAFVDYRDMWVGQGFVTMARTLLAREGVRKRLLAFPDGERRLTDLLHCVELLQNAAMEERLGVEGLLKWFAAQGEGNGAVEAQQMRLETDEAALKVITIHKSKGLEFPIVFCPYAWSAVAGPSDQATFHDPQDKTLVIKDLGSADLPAHQLIEREEALAEQCRLFYVALTRAKYRCYVCWGAVRDAGLAAPAYLLHYHGNPTVPDLAGTVRANFESLTDTQLLKDLHALALRSGAAIEVLDLPATSLDPYKVPDPPTSLYSAREFGGRIAHDWGTTSFSRWASGGAHGVEGPDHDAVMPLPGVAELHAPEAAKSIRDFPRGMRAGTFLHGVFQELEFTDAASTRLEELVRRKLGLFGFGGEWLEPVCGMIRNVLATPLEVGDDGVVLGQLTRSRRIAEMEFSFPLDRVTPLGLREVFAAYPAGQYSSRFAERLGSLGFAPLRGMMRGFIDLVFEWRGRHFLIDWKSNSLGDAVESYARGRLQEVMESRFYVLQYHLYAVALHRYLSWRIPGYSYEKDFGGAFYVFLRGVDPARGPEAGIYFDRPPVARIEALNRLLSPEQPLLRWGAHVAHEK